MYYLSCFILFINLYYFIISFNIIMSQIMDKYFGPLSREYCVYFYALSVVFGALFAISTVSIVSFMIMNYKKVDMMFIGNSTLMLINTFLAYLANRLLHTMCVKIV